MLPEASLLKCAICSEICGAVFRARAWSQKSLDLHQPPAPLGMTKLTDESAASLAALAFSLMSLNLIKNRINDALANGHLRQFGTPGE